MEMTQHAHQRMSQRGITRTMIELVHEFGTIEHDKSVLGRKAAERLVKELQEKLRVAKKILDKGGVVVVECGDAVVTTYNRNSSN